MVKKQTRPLQIATSRYFSKAQALVDASGLVPIGHTTGPPRWGAPEAGNIGMLAPHGIDKELSEQEFTPLYVARLERFGVERIQAVLQAIADAYDAPGVVLLCFEDLTKEGEWCHRRVFADWWLQQTGEEVPELEP
jgi:hypothetical protein